MPEIHKLSPALLDAYLDFFDHRAFTDNPGWSSCYCNCYYADHCAKPWGEYSGAENRAAVAARITAGEMDGYLAMEGDQAVGWCSAAPMAKVPWFDDRDLPDKATTGVFVCFVIEQTWRGRGLARTLLREACADFTRMGLRYAEGRPRPAAASAAANFLGPHSLYVSEGFEEVGKDKDAGKVVMRKRLGP